MFTQVRTHFTVNTPRLIVHTCSEDCSEFTKSFSCPPLKNFLIFLAELEILGLSAGKGPMNRERNLGFDHTRPDSFLCRHETFSGIVWTPIWYVTLHFRDPHGAASLRYRKRAKSPFLCVNRSPVRNGLCAGVKAIRFSVNIASDRLPDGRQNTPQNLGNRPVTPDGWRHQACHAYRMFFYQIHCVPWFRL